MLFQRSFVFRKRCRTPPKSFKQQELNEFLKLQMEQRQNENQLNKQEATYLERMEQMKLAEE